jgi:hypothetical protein
MNNALLLLPPVINTLVTGLFAGVVLRQYFKRRRSYQLYWSCALSMAFLATLAYIGMLAVGPTSGTGVLFFRLYYALGGSIMPAWLGLGSIALVSSKRIANICFSALSLLSVIAVSLVFLAQVNMAKLSVIAGTPGTGTLEPGAWLITTIVLNTLGVVAVAGVALYSGWKLIRHQKSIAGMHTSNIVWANIFIFVGAILDGVAGSLARFLGLQSSFWLIMALGWLVLFSGVALASRRSRTARQQAQTDQARQTTNV